MGRFTGVLGMAVILGLAWLFSTDRRAIKLKTVAWGLGLQLALGFFVLRSGAGSAVFGFLGDRVGDGGPVHDERDCGGRKSEAIRQEL